MLIDYHTHTAASPDGKGRMEEYVRAAAGKSLAEIGFSDHVEFSSLLNSRNPLADRMSEYVSRFQELREKAKPPIKLGVELGFFPDNVERIRQFSREHPFDYVIGAVHEIEGWTVDNPAEIEEYSRRDTAQVYEQYFALVRQLCKTRMFDIVAHPDLIKIFGFKPAADYTEILVETAEAMVKADVCAEINTKGLVRPCREAYPSPRFLGILHDYGVPIVFGSDAHEPSEVGRRFEDAVKLAMKAGYTHSCVFKRRERSLVEL